MDVQVLNEAEVLAKLDRTKVKDALKLAFAGLHGGKSVQPAQTVTVFPDDAGDSIFYPGVLWDAGLIGVKVSPYISSLAKAGKSPVTAYTLLLSSTTGEPTLLCDSLALTAVRTAATTSLALDYLIPKEATTLAVIGAGKIAIEHLRYAVEQHNWSQINVYSPSLAAGDAGRRDAVQAAVSQEVTFSSSAELAVGQADVVLLCTSSGTPVVQPDWLAHVKVVTSISTNVPGAHEIDPTSISDFDVYCDYAKTAPDTAGDLILAQRNGWSTDQIVADLPGLVTGQGKVSGAQRAYFRSTGLGIEDLAIASLLV